MSLDEFKELIRNIVEEAAELKNKHTDQKKAAVNYSAIFCKNDKEYKDFNDLANKLGVVYKDTVTGAMFLVDLDTESGRLRLLKIRKPDETRRERGDADFTIDDYDKFKKDFLGKDGFKLIKRESFEMIELMDPGFNVRVYFSNPPLDQQFKLSK